MRFALEEIERHLRNAMKDAFYDNAFLNPQKVKRTDDIADMSGFGEDFLDSINYYEEHDLALHARCDGDDLTPHRFGRRIKDWVSLLAWRDGILDLTQMPAGLSFYSLSRSYILDKVAGNTDKISWTFRSSEEHDVSDEPAYYSRQKIMSFERVPLKDSYDYLFTQLWR